MTDIIIVGGGPAGMTAAIYGVRAGLSVTAVEKMASGGQMTTTADIENYPGTPGITGIQLSARMEEQVRALGVEVLYREVTSLSLVPGALSAVTTEGELPARTMILAMGAKRKHLGIPGEEEFAGRGVSYCAVCDGGFFRGKPVAVVGGGNAAVEDALLLSGLCPRVFLLLRHDTFKAGYLLLEALKKTTNVEILTNTVVDSVEGEKTVEFVRLTNQKTGDKTKLPVAGLFVAIGTAPESGMLRGAAVPMDAAGWVVAGEDGATGIPGVFVAGDLRKKGLRQIVTASADGANAASAAARFLQKG